MLTLLLALACSDPPAPADTAPVAAEPPVQPDVTPGTPILRRLTSEQYGNTVHDLLGADLVLPNDLEPDEAASGLREVGAGTNAVSPHGVEQYEEGAYLLARQALAEDHRAAVVPCTPSATVDDACAEQFVRTLGRRAWRRSLTEEEVTRLVGVAQLAATQLGDFHQGLEFALAALLQSPNFLYRVELGEPDANDPALRRLTGAELATRLAYFLWNTTPDDTLLDAAELGALDTDEGLQTQLARMLADPRARQGVRAFFDDMLRLYVLDDMIKDTTVFVHMSPDVGPAAREETLLGLEALVAEGGDYRSFYTTRRTFVDRKLAAIYGVRAPAREGFGEVTLPDDGGRRGFLGQVGFLAPNAHAVSSSATRRGIFLREVVLCQEIPAPPAGVNTSIPEPDADARTLRERVAVHLEDPSCASCHRLMDPIGLGLENFDGLAGWRTTEAGATIDPSGELDGVAFADAWELGQVVADHPRVGACLAETMYRYAVGRPIAEGEEDEAAYLTARLALAGHAVQALQSDIVLSPGFRNVGALP